MSQGSGSQHSYSVKTMTTRIHMHSAGAFKAHLVIHNFFSQTGRHHLLQSFLFALCLSSQLRRAMTEPGDVILGGQNNKESINEEHIQR